jgi:hypothetical protein
MISPDVTLCCASNLQSATPNETVTFIFNAVKTLNLTMKILRNLNNPSMNSIKLFMTYNLTIIIVVYQNH